MVENRGRGFTGVMWGAGVRCRGCCVGAGVWLGGVCCIMERSGVSSSCITRPNSA